MQTPVTGVEQPFDCFVIQNRQAMQSMGSSMDWTVKESGHHGQRQSRRQKVVNRGL